MVTNKQTSKKTKKKTGLLSTDSCCSIHFYHCITHKMTWQDISTASMHHLCCLQYTQWLTCMETSVVFLICCMMHTCSFFPRAVVQSSREHSHLFTLFCFFSFFLFSFYLYVCFCVLTPKWPRMRAHTLLIQIFFLMILIVQVCAHPEPRCSNPPCILFSLCN